VAKSKKNDTFTCQFSIRFREERKKLNLTQVEAAKLCGVSRKSWGEYETAKTVPGAEVLSRFAAIGADVNYLTTGIRTSDTVCEQPGYYGLRPDQAALLDNLEHCSKEDQQAIKQMALSLAEAKKDDQETEFKKTINAG